MRLLVGLLVGQLLLSFFILWHDLPTISNQIYIVTFTNTQLTQALFLQKKSTLQNGFLISVTLRWHRASVACKNLSF
jgi:hypothetical protein